jgi:hypothetical protein
MINTILIEAQKIINSEDFWKKIDELVYTFELSENDQDNLSSTLSRIISGEIPEKDFVDYFLTGSDIKKDMGERIYEETRKKILIPFQNRVAEIVKNHPENKVAGDTSAEKPETPPARVPLREAIPVRNVQPQTQLTQSSTPPIRPTPTPPAQPSPQPSYQINKQTILNEIENPPRTTIKRYVVEYDHEPIKDSSHLIGDKVDETLKLQDHYNN